jgi:hypothetical protein
LRCFDQKRRFGFDLRYPAKRYADALKGGLVPDRTGKLVPNPLFGDVQRSGAASRSPYSVFLAVITGVPWQDLADMSTYAPGAEVQYLLPQELVIQNRWDWMVGSPADGVPPTDPLMRESVRPRDGTNPATTGSLAPPDAPFMANQINGHERNIPSKDDLQYACIVPLLKPRDCGAGTTSSGTPACECPDPTLGINDPLCQDPSNGNYVAVQHFAKAYPGTRQLEVVRELGDNAFAGSICAPQVTDTASAEFGYRPVVRSVVRHIGESLRGERCLPTPLHADPSGSVKCQVIEATRSAEGECRCGKEGRAEVSAAVRERASATFARNGRTDFNCFCEILEHGKQDRVACQNDPGPLSATGWCYVGAGVEGSRTFTAVGAPELVAACPPSSRQRLRFTGQANPEANAATLLLCPPDVFPDPTVDACDYALNCRACPNTCELCLCQTKNDRVSCDRTTCR